MNFKKILSLVACALVVSSTTVFGQSKDKLSEKRIYGSDRYETSIKVSKEGWKNSSCAIICRGDVFADALCAVPLAKRYDAPILLINKDKVNKEVIEELKRLKVTKVFITGGEGAVSKNIQNEIKSINGIKEVKRLGGLDRYETSEIIAENVESRGEIAVTSGASPADALSISAIAANKNMPILLASKDKQIIKKYLNKNNVSKSFVIGGESCVSKDIEKELPNVERIYGTDRYKTNEKIIKRFSKNLSFKKIYMALAQSERGDEFADALSASALAAKGNNPMVLVYKNKKVAKDTEDFVKCNSNNESIIYVLGGEKLIPQNVVNKLTTREKSNNNESNKPKSKHSSSSGSSDKSGKLEQKNTEYTISMESSFPGAFTYDIRVSTKKGNEILKGYKLLYDEKIIAEDKNGDGIVKPLAIFFGKDTDKSKFKILKDGKEIKVNELN